MRQQSAADTAIATRRPAGAESPICGAGAGWQVVMTAPRRPHQTGLVRRLPSHRAAGPPSHRAAVWVPRGADGSAGDSCLPLPGDRGVTGRLAGRDAGLPPPGNLSHPSLGIRNLTPVLLTPHPAPAPHQPAKHHPACSSLVNMQFLPHSYIIIMFVSRPGCLIPGTPSCLVHAKQGLSPGFIQNIIPPVFRQEIKEIALCIVLLMS